MRSREHWPSARARPPQWPCSYFPLLLRLICFYAHSLPPPRTIQICRICPHSKGFSYIFLTALCSYRWFLPSCQSCCCPAIIRFNLYIFDIMELLETVDGNGEDLSCRLENWSVLFLQRFELIFRFWFGALQVFVFYKHLVNQRELLELVAILLR